MACLGQRKAHKVWEEPGAGLRAPLKFLPYMSNQTNEATKQPPPHRFLLKATKEARGSETSYDQNPT